MANQGSMNPGFQTTDTVPGSMRNPFSSAQLPIMQASNSSVQFILHHLILESKQLDRMIAGGLKMKDLLAEPSSNGNGTTTEADLKQIDKDLILQLEELANGRPKIQSIIKSISPTAETISDILPSLSDPIRQQIKQELGDIKKKTNTIRAIIMGNQTVLVYTLNYYQRLLAGLNPEPQNSSGYNADGKMATGLGGNVVRKEC